jgi:hypothetical protein
VAGEAPVFADQSLCAVDRGRETRNRHQQRGEQRKLEKFPDRSGRHGLYTFWRIPQEAGALMLCAITTSIFPP